MCGIAGLISLSGGSNFDLRSISSNIAEKLSHRGPDHISTFSDDYFALSHTRLSIRDLNPRSNQPFISTITGSVLSYNGEIYNTSDLLNLLDCHLRDTIPLSSDTAILSALLDTYGVEALKYLVGTFSFAWYDKSSDALYLVRDRLGVKPLYYTSINDHIYFASEISALKPFISKTVNHQSFSEYLWFGNRLSSSNTFYEDILSVEPAGLVRISNGQLKSSRWWHPDDWFNCPTSSASISDTFDESISKQSISDVPICLLLSGGIDSSFLSSYYQDNDVKAVYADFGNLYSKNELLRAKFVAQHHNIPFETISISPHIQSICNIQNSFGEPFADPATIPLDSIYHAISHSYRVCIQGDGADELFSGYSRHKFLRYYDFISNTAKPVSYFMKSVLPNRVKRLLELYSSPYNYFLYAYLMTVHTPTSSPFSLLNKDYSEYLLSTTDFALEFKKVFDRYSGFSPLFVGYLCDLLIQLPSQFFPKVDITSMSHSLEARVPLADDNLLRLSLNLTDKSRVSRFRGKSTLREVFASKASLEINRKIVQQRKKGFNTPFSFWLKNELASEFRSRILDPQFYNLYNFNSYKLTTFIDDYLNNSRSNTSSNDFTAFQLFCLSFHT